MAQEHGPSVCGFELLRRGLDMLHSRVDVGDQRFEQTRLALQRSEAQRRLPRTVCGPAHRGQQQGSARDGLHARWCAACPISPAHPAPGAGCPPSRCAARGWAARAWLGCAAQFGALLAAIQGLDAGVDVQHPRASQQTRHQRARHIALVGRVAAAVLQRTGRHPAFEDARGGRELSERAQLPVRRGRCLPVSAQVHAPAQGVHHPRHIAASGAVGQRRHLLAS